MACNDKSLKACAVLGSLYLDGIGGVKQDYFKAVEFYTKSCDGGVAYICTNLGIMYADGKGVRQDYIKAKEYFGKACDGGATDGCKYYAILNKM